MSTTPEALQNSTRTWLDDIIDRVDAEIPKLEARRDALIAEVNDLNDQITKARRMLTIVSAPKKPDGRKRSYRSRNIKTQIGKEKLMRIELAIRHFSDTDRFTIPEIHKNFADQWTMPTTRAAFKFLRSIEFVGVAGQSPHPHPAQLWRIIDRDAYERYLEGANASQKQ